MKEALRKIVNRNKYLKGINRLRNGFTPVYIEYGIDFRPRWDGDTGNPHLASIISKSEKTYKSNLRDMASCVDTIQKLSANELPFSIDWKNHHMPVLDGLSMMWAAKRTRSTFMEVGSGFSTLYTRAALIGDNNKKTKIVSIDPAPRTGVDSICDEVIRQRVEDVDLSTFDRLRAGDTLFIDNSHRSFMNSDVTVFMLDILPRLKPGVLIGIHDIFLPFDYLESWSERGYNEQYLLACYLLSNPGYFKIQLANYWISRKRLHNKPLQKVWDILGTEVRDRPSSAFWCIKK